MSLARAEYIFRSVDGTIVRLSHSSSQHLVVNFALCGSHEDSVAVLQGVIIPV